MEDHVRTERRPAPRPVIRFPTSLEARAPTARPTEALASLELGGQPTKDHGNERPQRQRTPVGHVGVDVPEERGHPCTRPTPGWGRPCETSGACKHPVRK